MLMLLFKMATYALFDLLSQKANTLPILLVLKFPRHLSHFTYNIA